MEKTQLKSQECPNQENIYYNGNFDNIHSQKLMNLLLLLNYFSSFLFYWSVLIIANNPSSIAL